MIISLCIFIPLALIAIVIGGYAIYMQANYYRIKDNLELDINNNQDTLINKSNEYTIMTYNIGFGAYSQDFSFFMDSGKMLSGKKVQGKYGRGKSKNEVLKNTNGSIDIMNRINPDFMLIQEVDVKGYRSYNINQKQMIIDNFSSYTNTFACNYHCPFVMLPLNDPMGTATSGLLSLSRYKMESSLRRSLPISKDFISKFTDLDRCIDITRYDLGDKDFVLINVHLSAYDKGGVYRAKQIKLINSILEEEKNNYVIIGGDFNHDIADSINNFPTGQQNPSWVSYLTNDDLIDGYRLVADGTSWGSCRAAELPYVEGVNHVVTVDGFIVSDNIKVNSVTNIYKNSDYLDFDNTFLFSDHLPSVMKFEFI